MIVDRQDDIIKSISNPAARQNEIILDYAQTHFTVYEESADRIWPTRPYM